MFIRTLAFLGVLAAATTARADVGVGLFVGEPSGLDIKIGLQRSSAIDLVFGWETIRRGGRDPYGHLTYLLTPFYGTGRSVIVPLRLGIGVAVFDQGGRFGDDMNVAVRAPLEIALKFRSTPLELYGEIAIKLTVFDEYDNYDTVDLDGGAGLRFYF